MTEPEELYALMWRPFYGACSYALKQYIRHAFLRWQADNGWPKTCAICHKRVASSQRSLDHIIPQSLCWKLGLELLIIDPRNFRMTHRVCNATRKSNIADLPPAVQKKLAELQAALQSA